MTRNNSTHKLGSFNFDLAAIEFYEYSIEKVSEAMRNANPSRELIDIKSTYYHEQTHWLQSISTIWGLLRLRKRSNIRTHVQRGMQYLIENKPDIYIGLPLVKWLREENRFEKLHLIKFGSSKKESKDK